MRSDCLNLCKHKAECLFELLSLLTICRWYKLFFFYFHNDFLWCAKSKEQVLFRQIDTIRAWHDVQNSNLKSVRNHAVTGQ